MKGNHSVVGAGISASKTSKTGKASGNNVGPIPEAEGIQGSNNGNRKRKQKSSPFKVRMDWNHNFAGFKLLLSFFLSFVCFGMHFDNMEIYGHRFHLKMKIAMILVSMTLQKPRCGSYSILVLEESFNSS